MTNQKPKSSPARAIRSASDEVLDELERNYTAAAKDYGPYMAVKEAQANPKNLSKMKNTAKTLLPIVKDEKKKRSQRGRGMPTEDTPEYRNGGKVSLGKFKGNF